MRAWRPHGLTPLLLPSQIELPRHVDLMKTATFKELPPLDLDWFYTRTAAVARRVYMRAGLGMKDFRRTFGGRSFAKGRVMPEHFKLAAGGNIRHALQQLEKMGIVAKCPDNHGRKMTVEGRRLMDLVARSVPCTRLVVA